MIEKLYSIYTETGNQDEDVNTYESNDFEINIETEQ